MRHRIKLMWDYSCWPLWQYDGEIFDNVDPKTLSLSASTLTRLEAWSAVPDAKLAEVEYPPDIKWSAEETLAFELEGFDLWRTIRSELGLAYEVEYYSTVQGGVIGPDDGPAR